MRYASFAGGQVTNLNIDSCKHFGLKPAHLNLILSRCGKQMKHLKLRGSFTGDVLQGPVPSFTLPNLQTLYLGLGVKLAPAWLSRILHASARTLEELSIFDLLNPDGTTPITSQGLNWPKLDKLRALCLACSSGTQVDMVCLEDPHPLRTRSKSNMPYMPLLLQLRRIFAAVGLTTSFGLARTQMRSSGRC